MTHSEGTLTRIPRTLADHIGALEARRVPEMQKLGAEGPDEIAGVLALVDGNRDIWSFEQSTLLRRQLLPELSLNRLEAESRTFHEVEGAIKSARRKLYSRLFTLGDGPLIPQLVQFTAQVGPLRCKAFTQIWLKPATERSQHYMAAIKAAREVASPTGSDLENFDVVSFSEQFLGAALSLRDHVAFDLGLDSTLPASFRLDWLVKRNELAFRYSDNSRNVPLAPVMQLFATQLSRDLEIDMIFHDTRKSMDIHIEVNHQQASGSIIIHKWSIKKNKWHETDSLSQGKYFSSPLFHVVARVVNEDGVTSISIPNLRILFHELGHCIDRLLWTGHTASPSGLDYRPLWQSEWLSSYAERLALSSTVTALGDANYRGVQTAQWLCAVDAALIWPSRAAVSLIDSFLASSERGKDIESSYAHYGKLMQEKGIYVEDLLPHLASHMCHHHPGMYFVYLLGEVMAVSPQNPIQAALLEAHSKTNAEGSGLKRKYVAEVAVAACAADIQRLRVK
jgi:hypothetical protein